MADMVAGLDLTPNALLAGFACWVWWPKSSREWGRFGLVWAYLGAFFLVMVFVFHYR
jgi:hypothetical protein